jgi:hypothetical protein
MKQTSIEWLQGKLNNVKPTDFCSIETIKQWVEQAKEMHKQETASNCSQHVTDNHALKISDEEIEKASYKFWQFKEHTLSTCWKMGAKWYREQLKQK